MVSWRSVSNGWRKFRRLPGPERLLFLQTWALVSLSGLALRCLGFRRWQTTLARLAPLGTPCCTYDLLERREQAQRLAVLVQTAARWSPTSPTCLHRSLTLWWLLRCRDIDSALRIGVRKVGDRLEAHAWIEYQDLVLNDREDVHITFIAFDRAIEPLQA